MTGNNVTAVVSGSAKTERPGNCTRALGPLAVPAAESHMACAEQDCISIFTSLLSTSDIGGFGAAVMLGSTCITRIIVVRADLNHGYEIMLLLL